jgi:uncharacterized protein (TIGR02266 family)
MGSDQRQHVRRALPVKIRGRDSDGIGQLQFVAGDLSAGGAFLKSDLLLEDGETLELEFQVPGVPRVLRAQARIAWVKRFPGEGESGGMGVQFAAMSDEDREVLTDYLAHD